MDRLIRGQHYRVVNVGDCDGLSISVGAQQGDVVRCYDPNHQYGRGKKFPWVTVLRTGNTVAMNPARLAPMNREEGE